MSNKNKTVSFRVSETTFERLRDIAEHEELSLSALFREYVDTFVESDGKVRVVPERDGDDPDVGFPPRVEVPKEFVREHERLELENEYLELEINHLREQLDEHRTYIESLREQLDGHATDHIFLEDLDQDFSDDEPLRLG